MNAKQLLLLNYAIGARCCSRVTELLLLSWKLDQAQIESGTPEDMNVFMRATAPIFYIGVSLNVYHQAKENCILFVSEINKTVTVLSFSFSQAMEEPVERREFCPHS